MNSSRLVRTLSALAVSEVPLSHKDFIGRLSRHLSMADSVSLSSALAKRAGGGAEPVLMTGAALTEAFVQVRRTLVQGVVQSFASEASRIKLPALNPDELSDSKFAYAPYLRFYTAHQREFEAVSQRLQTQVRDAVATQSPELARLVALDQVLSSALANPARKLLMVTPRLLATRFEVLLKAAEPTAPMAWFEAFCREMKAVLLAELEVRLLPTLGLIEAVNGEAAMTMQVNRQA